MTPIVIQYYLCYLLYCRIHVLAGLLNDSISADEAEKTFISNIRQAADECSKVATARNFHRDHTCTGLISCTIIIEIDKHRTLKPLWYLRSSIEVVGPPSTALH